MMPSRFATSRWVNPWITNCCAASSLKALVNALRFFFAMITGPFSEGSLTSAKVSVTRWAHHIPIVQANVKDIRPLQNS